MSEVDMRAKLHCSVRRHLIFMLAALLLIAAFASDALAVDPVFLNISNNQRFNLSEDTNFFMYVLAEDADMHYPLNFTDTAASETTNFTAFKMKKYNSTAAKINFTPLNNDVGNYEFYIIVEDTNDEWDGVKVIFNVTNVNDRPNITGYYPPIVNGTTVKEGGWKEFNISVLDDDVTAGHGDFLTYVWYLNGTVNRTLLNFSDGRANFTPDYFSEGAYNISVFVNDSEGEYVWINWSVNVSNSNRVPIFNESTPIANVTIVEDGRNISVLNLSYHFYDLDVDDYPLSFSVIGNYNMTVLINATEPYNVSVIPNPNFYGINNLQFNCSDGYNWTLSNVVVVNVTPVNDPPVVQQVQNQTAYAEVPYSLQIVASDVDYTDTITYYDYTSLFNINPSTGFISDTFAVGEIGDYNIRIDVGDGTVNTSMFFNLSVINNTAPVIGGKPLPDIYTTEDNYTKIYFNASDVNLDDILFFWSETNKPSPDDLTMITVNNSAENASAYFEFTPDQSDVGSWWFTLFVNDSKGATDYDNMTLYVSNIEHPPSLGFIEDQKIKVNITFYMAVTATDEDGNIDKFGDDTYLFNISTISGGANGVGNINFTPNGTDVGVHWVNITVNDSAGGIDWQLVMFNITLNHPPTIDPIPPQNAVEDALFNYQVVASDEDVQDTLSYADNSTLFNISPSNGLISFTPNLSDTGSYEINISVTDGEVVVWTMMNLTIGSYNDYPYWDPPLDQYFVNASNYMNTPEWNTTTILSYSTNMTVWNSSILEDNHSVIYVYAYDEESATLDFDVVFINYTNASGDVHTSGIDLFNITPVLGTKAKINFTPNNSQVGSYYVNFTADDKTGQMNVTTLRIDVINVNDVPTIIDYSPEVLYYQNMSENSSLEFSVTAVDVDFNSSIRYQWAINGTNISGTDRENFTYTADYLSAGVRQVLVYVLDEFNASTMLNWTVNVSNVNRIGWFGQIRVLNYTDFYEGQGDVTRTNVSLNSSGHVELATNAFGYLRTGIYESTVYDVRETNSRHEFTNISWTGNTSDTAGVDFNVTFQSRTYNVGSPFASCPDTISAAYNETDTYTSSGADFVSDNYRCVQYRVFFGTNTTEYSPLLDDVMIGYDIADREQEQNTDQSWIALDYYFYEPDSDDNVTFYVTDSGGTNVSRVNISIGDSTPYEVRVVAGEDYSGTLDLVFHMSDGYNVTDSNLVRLTIIEASTIPEVIIVPVGGGGGGSVAQPQPIEVPKYVVSPVSFRLIAPQHVTTYVNNTIDIPINLFNSNFTMNDLRLKATTSNPDVKLTLSQTYFKTMAPNEVKYLNLRVESYKTYGTYEVIVEAQADAVAIAEDGTERTSTFNERAKIFVNSLLKAEGNESQVNTKLAFAEDLLSSNPECLELNEFLKKVRVRLEAGDTAEADRLLAQVVESCKYLIAPRDREPVVEGPAVIYGMPQESVMILGAVAFVTLAVAIALVVGWTRIKSRRREIIRK